MSAHSATSPAKRSLDDLAVLGGPRLFEVAKSTSNLVRPDLDRFLGYSRTFFAAHQYTNNGPLVRLLEERLARFHGAPHCITFCSGFWALAVAMKLLALRGRAEVVMPSLTYRRLADVAAWAGLRPRFCEVDEPGLSASPETMRASITSDTALLIGIHPIVGCCDVAGLERLSAACGVPLLFDSVESVYEHVPEGKVGGFGAAECFSLHASKFLNGFEGGYITTRDAQLARRLRLTRGFGFEGESNVVVPHGLNAKLNEVHAAMALASLDDVEAQVQRNRHRYELYRELLAGLPGLRLLAFDEALPTSYKNIVVELLDAWPLSRADTLSVLEAENVLARAYYHPPLHRRKMAYPHVPATLPRTDRLSERFMNLPCGHLVVDEDIRRVVDLLAFMAGHGPPIAARLRSREAGR